MRVGILDFVWQEAGRGRRKVYILDDIEERPAAADLHFSVTCNGPVLLQRMEGRLLGSILTVPA